MKTLTDVSNLPVGTVLDAFKGLIVDVKKYFPETGSGTTSSQLVIFGDGKERLNAIFRGQKEVQPRQINTRVCLLSKPVDGKPTGVTVRTKDGIAALLVTAEATISPVQELSSKPVVADPEDDIPFGEPAPSEQTPAPAMSVEDAAKQAEIVLGRAGCAMRLALGMALHTRDWLKKAHKEVMSPEQFRVITSTYFIHLSQSGLVTFLPSGDPNHKE